MIGHQLSNHSRPGDLYCNINLENELVFYGCKRFICVYCTRTESNVWSCKKLYMVIDGSTPISILKNDKAYLRINDSIYEFDTFTGDSESILVNDNETKEISDTKVSSNKRFTYLR